MSLEFIITNEDGMLAEYKAVTAFPPSTFEQPAGSGMRGDRSARTTMVAGDNAFGTLYLPANTAAAATTPVAIGFHLKVISEGDWVNGDRVDIVDFYNGGTLKGYIELTNSGGDTVVRVNIVDAFNMTATYTDTLDLGTDDHYVQVVASWGAPLLIALYIDGALRGLAASGIPVPTPGPDRVRIGCISSGGAPTITYRVDHVKGGSALGDVAEDVSPPDAPTALTATAVVTGPTFAAVDLAWTDNADDEDGFVLERAPDVAGVAGDWAEIDTAAADAVSYSDTGVDPGRYWYRVAATNVGGDSDYATTTASVMVGGEYRFYLGVGSRTAIDYDTAVAETPAGTATVDIAGLSEDVDYYIAVRAVSAAGTEEENTHRVCRVRAEDGALVGQPPKRLLYAHAEPAAGGAIKFSFAYNADGELGTATHVQVVQCSGRGAAARADADWANPIDEIAIPGNAPWSGLLTDTYEDGETVYLAARAVTATDVGGEISRPDGSPVACDAGGPDAVSYISASQATVDEQL